MLLARSRSCPVAKTRVLAKCQPRALLPYPFDRLLQFVLLPEFLSGNPSVAHDGNPQRERGTLFCPIPR